MEISIQIANLIDCHNGIFTFGSTFESEELLNIFLKDIFSKLKSKEFITLENIETYKDIEKYNFSNKVFLIDLKTLSNPKHFGGKRVFSVELNKFCFNYNNIAIFLANMNLDLTNPPYLRITPTEILYASNAVWTLNNNILRNPKNRYEIINGKSYNLIAYLRNYKIDQILED